MIRSALILAILIFGYLGYGQEKVTTFGFQIKPLIPSELLGTGSVSTNGQENQYQIRQRAGYSFGGVLRKGFTPWLSLETGISYVRRNYEATVFNASSNLRDTSRFRIIGYEIPVTGLVFVRLSERIYMDGAFGLALDMFPSEVGSAGVNNQFYQRSFRNSWVESSEVMPWLNVGLVANVGFEYRTENSGYFYFGASYHRPFKMAYNSVIDYDWNNVNEEGNLQLRGNYLTLDFKYFFHEPPQEAKDEDDKKPFWYWFKR